MKFTHTQHITGYTVTLWHCGLLGKPCAMRKQRYCCSKKVHGVSDQGQSENIGKRFIGWWMDGWMDGQRDRRAEQETEGQIDGQRDGRTKGQTDLEMDRETDKRTSRGSDGGMDRQTEGQREGRTDWQMEERTNSSMTRWTEGWTAMGGREGKTNGRIDGWIFDAEKAWVRG